MKKVFVLMRVLVLKDKTNVRFPMGVFTDQADAQRASDEFSGSLGGLTPESQRLLGYLGVIGVGGVVVEQDFTAGSGLTLVDKPGLVDAGGKLLG
jgi:hypothetical protein